MIGSILSFVLVLFLLNMSLRQYARMENEMDTLKTIVSLQRSGSLSAASQHRSVSLMVLQREATKRRQPDDEGDREWRTMSYGMLSSHLSRTQKVIISRQVRSVQRFR